MKTSTSALWSERHRCRWTQLGSSAKTNKSRGQLIWLLRRLAERDDPLSAWHWHIGDQAFDVSRLRCPQDRDPIERRGGYRNITKKFIGDQSRPRTPTKMLSSNNAARRSCGIDTTRTGATDFANQPKLPLSVWLSFSASCALSPGNSETTFAAQPQLLARNLLREITFINVENDTSCSL